MQGKVICQSLVVDADIGVGASTRNAFLAAFETVKDTSTYPAVSTSVGMATNRSGVDLILYWEHVRSRNMADAPLKVKLELQQKPYGHSGPRTGPRPCGTCAKSSLQIMVLCWLWRRLSSPTRNKRQRPGSNGWSCILGGSSSATEGSSPPTAYFDRVDIERIPMHNCVRLSSMLSTRRGLTWQLQPRFKPCKNAQPWRPEETQSGCSSR